MSLASLQKLPMLAAFGNLRKALTKLACRRQQERQDEREGAILRPGLERGIRHLCRRPGGVCLAHVRPS